MSTETVQRWINAMCCSDHPLWSNEKSAAAVDLFFSCRKTANVREPSLRRLFALRQEKKLGAVRESCDFTIMYGTCFFVESGFPDFSEQSPVSEC